MIRTILTTLFFAGETLSGWIEALVSCARQTEDFNIQSAAMGTLLDLINVSLCVYPDRRSQRLSPVTANVVPLITREDFALLEASSIYKVCLAAHNFHFMHFIHF